MCVYVWIERHAWGGVCVCREEDVVYREKDGGE